MESDLLTRLQVSRKFSVKQVLNLKYTTHFLVSGLFRFSIHSIVETIANLGYLIKKLVTQEVLTFLKIHTSLVSETWRDSAIRVEGEEVELLVDAFERTWTKNKIWKKQIFYFEGAQKSALVRLNDGKNKRHGYYRDLLFRIRSAKKYICFSNAYFSTPFSTCHGTLL